MVYVVNYNNQPLMPCSNVIARLLLKQNKAKVLRREPFTIKLLYKPAKEYVQKCILGVDTGSSKIGTAVVDENNNVLYLSEVTVRNDIKRKMDRRRRYRRTRRNRKTRYRKPRWNNRKNSMKEGRIPLTLVSKIFSHVREIEFIKKLLPITKIVIEVGKFDIQLMQDPSLKYRPWGYQRGVQYGYSNVREYVLTRDKHICQYCKGKTKDTHLEVHHIIPRGKGGTDVPNNLITLCHTCHHKLHMGEIKLKKVKKTRNTLRHATHMNIIASQLQKFYRGAISTYGYITKVNRQKLNLPKEHHYDAVAIASAGKEVIFKQKNILYKRCVAKGDYQQTKGIRSEKRIPTGKLFGFKKFDKVIYDNVKCFIKGRRSTGYFEVMNINNTKLKFKHTPKFVKTKRIGARKSWIMIEKVI